MDNAASIILIFILLVVAAVVGFVMWRALYKVPGPDEALVITGSGARLTKEFKAQLEADRTAELQTIKANGPDGLDIATDALATAVATDPVPEFKIVVGSGTVVRPGQRMERMSLAMQEAEVTVQDVPTKQGIKTTVTAVVLYKVGDRYNTIARAARRFSGDPEWTKKIANLLEGHLRAVVGSLPFEEIWRNQEQTAKAVRAASTEDLQKLGLQIDSFQLRHIDDPDGYIEDLGAGVRAEAAKNARIARADAEQLAARSEAERAAETAEAQAASQVKQAQVRAEAEQAQATADQAKPLADARAQQAVIEERTKNATLQAQLTEQELQATVYRQADAEAYQVRTKANAAKDVAIAEAEAEASAKVKASEAEAASRVQAATADATSITTAAEADATSRTRAAEASATATTVQAQAEADAAKARADAVRAAGEADAAASEARGLASAKVIRETGLAEAETQQAQGAALAANQEPIIRRALVDALPQIVAANAQAYARIGNLTVLDGMDGVNSGIAQALSASLAMVPAVFDSIRGTGGTGGSDGGGGGGTPATLEGPPNSGSGGAGSQVPVGATQSGGAEGKADGLANAGREAAAGAGKSARAAVGDVSSRAESTFSAAMRATTGVGAKLAAGVAQPKPSSPGLSAAARMMSGAPGSATAVLADHLEDAQAAADRGTQFADSALAKSDGALDRAESYVDKAEDLADEAAALADRVGAIGRRYNKVKR